MSDFDRSIVHDIEGDFAVCVDGEIVDRFDVYADAVEAFHDAKGTKVTVVDASSGEEMLVKFDHPVMVSVVRPRPN